MVVEHITGTSIVKNLGYLGALFIGLSTESYAILGAFMVLDTILGITRVGLNHGWKEVKSYRMTAGIISKLTVLLVPLLTVWAGKGVGFDLHWLATWALNALILAQLYSIIGNIYSIRIGKDIDEFDAVSWVLRRVQVVIEKVLKEGKPTINDPKDKSE